MLVGNTGKKHKKAVYFFKLLKNIIKLKMNSIEKKCKTELHNKY